MYSLSTRIRTALLTVLMLLIAFSAQASPTPTPAPTLPPFDESVPAYDENMPESLVADQLYAQAFTLINMDDGRVLMSQNADTRMNPASTTKIMTLLLAVEYYPNLSEAIKIPAEAANIPQDSSVVPVQVGEEMTMQDLLYGMMLRSGNDAANAVAVLIGGSLEGFVNMMNARAEELGCTGTHFSNAHGYTADDHYTTAHDMALIAQAAMQYSSVRKIVGSGQYTMNKTNMRDEYTIQNSNMLVVYGSDYRYSGATGVKTGTTSAAGQCLVSSAERDGISLLCVAFKSTTTFAVAKWQDATRLLDYGFSQYKTYSFEDLYGMLGLTVPISGAPADDPSGGIIRLNALINRSGAYEKKIYCGSINELFEDFKNHLTIEYTRELVAPIEVGTVIGRLTFTPEDGDVITAVLISDRSVSAVPAAKADYLGSLLARIPDWVYTLLTALAALLVVLIAVRIILSIHHARRRARARKRARERARARARERAQATRRQRPRY